MKKIKYFNKYLKENIDLIEELVEEDYEIKELFIEIDDLDLEYYLDIINKSYGQYGQVTVMEDLEEVKQSKILEMSAACEEKIINDFYSSCLGDRKKIDCTRDDQNYIMGLVAKAQMITSGVATDRTLDWKISGEPICYTWTPQQVFTLGMDLFNHLTEKKKRYEALRRYIDQLTDIETIKSITWDTEIPTAITETTNQQEGNIDAK